MYSKYDLTLNICYLSVYVCLSTHNPQNLLKSSGIDLLLPLNSEGGALVIRRIGYSTLSRLSSFSPQSLYLPSKLITRSAARSKRTSPVHETTH